MLAIRLVPDGDNLGAEGHELLKGAKLGGGLMGKTIADPEGKTLQS
jgi:hypothetical protein